MNPQENSWKRTVSSYATEMVSQYGTAQGLPDTEILSLALDAKDKIVVATKEGVVRLSGQRFEEIGNLEGSPRLVANTQEGILIVTSAGLYRTTKDKPMLVAPLPETLQQEGFLLCLAKKKSTLLGTINGLFSCDGHKITPVSGFNELLNEGKQGIRQMAVGPSGQVAVAAQAGLFLQNEKGNWKRLFPYDSQGRSWAPRDVRGVTFDRQNRLWFGSPQGVGFFQEGVWTLLTGNEGLPYDDFTTLASGEEGVVWFGTALGAIRYDGESWFYRQGPRWLPHDEVRCMAVTSEGHAWMGTKQGLSLIERRMTALKEMASFYEKEIDLYHRRTSFGYVDHVRLERPGDKSSAVQSDSDNDGLWTSMYGAGECFAYAAMGSPEAKSRAKAAFEALNFLREVTQGGTHPAPPGFVARTILPTSGPNPNEGTREKDRAKSEEHDSLWKMIDPRWPVSEDGKWYWKTDTSSDELDGHFFFYGLYYDLVAGTNEERDPVKKHVAAIANHLIDHGFQLVDHDDLPTRWARYAPEEMNGAQEWWVERGLNSLSILSHLATAEHICGGGRYREMMDKLIRDHGYGMNLMYCKAQFGQGSGNQSDDEMAFMNYYNLIRYAEDEKIRGMTAKSLSLYWRLVQAELNPFFNFIYAVGCSGESFQDAWGCHDLTPSSEDWLDDSVDTLKRFLRDRVQWPLKNSHRKDIQPLPESARWENKRPQGYRRCGKVLPIDERHVNHWNHDPWSLDCGGNGTNLSDGAVFLLPYYMGRYYGFIQE